MPYEDDIDAPEVGEDSLTDLHERSQRDEPVTIATAKMDRPALEGAVARAGEARQLLHKTVRGQLLSRLGNPHVQSLLRGIRAGALGVVARFAAHADRPRGRAGELRPLRDKELLEILFQVADGNSGLGEPPHSPRDPHWKEEELRAAIDATVTYACTRIAMGVADTRAQEAISIQREAIETGKDAQTRLDKLEHERLELERHQRCMAWAEANGLPYSSYTELREELLRRHWHLASLVSEQLAEFAESHGSKVDPQSLRSHADAALQHAIDAFDPVQDGGLQQFVPSTVLDALLPIVQQECPALSLHIDRDALLRLLRSPARRSRRAHPPAPTPGRHPTVSSNGRAKHNVSPSPRRIRTSQELLEQYEEGACHSGSRYAIRSFRGPFAARGSRHERPGRHRSGFLRYREAPASAEAECARIRRTALCCPGYSG